MRFEARELKAYLETVPAEQLAVGQVYFRVNFADRDLAVPELDAVVFIGHDLHPDGPGLYYQDVPRISRAAVQPHRSRGH